VDFSKHFPVQAERPAGTVAVSLLLLPADSDNGQDPLPLGDSCTASSKLAPAIADPAVAAFSISTKSCQTPTVHVPMQTPIMHMDCTSREHNSPVPSSQQTPEATPRLDMQQPWSWAPPQSATPPGSPFFNYGDSFLFSFSLRRADGVELGLDITRDEANQELHVQRVIPGGAAESWNRQCFAGPFSSKAVVPTDRIVGVNGRCDCEGMLQECRERPLLKLFIVRGHLPHAEIPFEWCGVSAPVQAVQIPAPAQAMQLAAPVPAMQFVPAMQLVPAIFFTVPCAKHGAMDGHGGFAANGTEPSADNNVVRTQFGDFDCEEQMAAPESFRAEAPEFFMPGPGQDGHYLGNNGTMYQ